MVFSIASTNAYAIDLGTQGKVFKINELDIRIQMIMSLTENLSGEKFKKEAERSANEFYRELPKYPLVNSRAYRVSYIDPTRVYEDAFWSFKENEKGEFKWYQISEPGQEVNWLEHHTGKVQKFYIFDSDSKKQRDIAKIFVDTQNPYLTIVMTGGDLVELSEFLGKPVTYLNDTLMREYDLQYTPVVISRGSGAQNNKYKKVRFNIEDVNYEDVLKEIKE